MLENGETEISITDKDARIMKANNGGTNVSYNVQSVVDSKHKLIVGMEVVSSASDNGLLGVVAPKVKEELHLEKTTVIADTGYYNTLDFKICEESGIIPIVAKQKERETGLYSANKFCYDAEQDNYICPNNSRLNYSGIAQEVYRRYINQKACKNCPLKSNCTNGNYREIKRHVFKEYSEKNELRLIENKNEYRQRKSLVEHPFGTIKRTMGIRQFLTRGKRSVSGEVALIFLCYNLKRLRNILTRRNPRGNDLLRMMLFFILYIKIIEFQTVNNGQK
jgi:hypothetical protein